METYLFLNIYYFLAYSTQECCSILHNPIKKGIFKNQINYTCIKMEFLTDGILFHPHNRLKNIFAIQKKKQ